MAGRVVALPQTSSCFSFVSSGFFLLTPPTSPLAVISTLTEKKKKKKIKKRTPLLDHMVTNNTALCLHINNHTANRRTQREEKKPR